MSLPSLVVRDGLAVRQWELLFAALDRDRRTVWRSPPLVGIDRWLVELWTESRNRPDASDTADLLSPAQTGALWLEVVRHSEVGSGLISPASAAALAEQAWGLVTHWEVRIADLEADGSEPEFAAFLSWTRRYTERLRDSGWTDRNSLLTQLPDALPEARGRAVRLLDVNELTPAQTRVLDGLRAGGWSISERAATASAGAARMIGLADPDVELRTAVAWAVGRLRENPKARLALIVPDLRRRRSHVSSLLDETLAAEPWRAEGETAPGRWLQHGGTLAEAPLVGAALSVLELLSPRGAFVELSRWLRSPFFFSEDVDEHARCAGLEAELRRDLRSQLIFLDAYRHAGLAATVRRAAPLRAAGLERAMAALEEREALSTPTAWASAWQRALLQLAWLGNQSPDISAAWETALGKLAQLTPIVGVVSNVRALDELRAIVARTRMFEHLPWSGISVYEELEAVGPGHDGIWATACTERRWLEPAATNTLLPRRLQVALAMPGSSPKHSLLTARRALDRFLARSPEIVFSWPRRSGDLPEEPSPLLGPFEQLPSAQAPAPVSTGRYSAAAPGSLERIADPAPPIRGTAITGGARTLDLQAACPLRAFCELRLSARELAPIARGLPPSVQGTLVHAAVDRLLRPTLRGARLDWEGLMASVPECVEKTLAEALGPAHGALQVLFRMERSRITRLLGAFLARESERPPFVPWDAERRVEIEIGAWSVTGRIDRVDRLADGGLAIIDYKTGGDAGVADWFRERLLGCQLPLYAVSLGASVAALVIVDFDRDRVAYQGAGTDSFGPKLRRLPEDRSWDEQIERWRGQIAALLDEYASGDVRIFPADAALAAGAYAPLTRVYEVLDDTRGL